MNINDVMLHHEKITDALHSVIKQRTANRICSIKYDKERRCFVVVLSASNSLDDECFEWSMCVSNEAIENQIYAETFTCNCQII